MTDDPSGDAGLSNNERREAARQKARVLREGQKKRDRRGRVILQGSLIVVVLAVIVVVGLVIVNSVRPPSAGPLNMLSDGIKIGEAFKAVPTAALEPDATPVPSTPNSANVIDLKIYVDYQCALCGTFQSTNAAQIKTWIESGAVTLEVHPLAILDSASLGHHYSTRAANAAACVANYSPNQFFDFNDLLFSHQPKANAEGLTDDQIAGLARDAKVQNLGSITSCIDNQKFKSWTNAATERATSDPLPDSDVKKLATTPTIIINGKRYAGAVNKAVDFAAAISNAAADSFTDNPTPSASATPTPTPSATPSATAAP